MDLQADLGSGKGKDDEPKPAANEETLEAERKGSWDVGVVLIKGDVMDLVDVQIMPIGPLGKRMGSGLGLEIDSLLHALEIAYHAFALLPKQYVPKRKRSLGINLDLPVCIGVCYL